MTMFTEASNIVQSISKVSHFVKLLISEVVVEALADIDHSSKDFPIFHISDNVYLFFLAIFP